MKVKIPTRERLKRNICKTWVWLQRRLVATKLATKAGVGNYLGWKAT